MKDLGFTSLACTVAKSVAMRRARWMCEHVDFNGNRCCSCLNLDAHHLTYERFGNELPEDLMILCRTHHIELHGH